MADSVQIVVRFSAKMADKLYAEASRRGVAASALVRAVVAVHQHDTHGEVLGYGNEERTVMQVVGRSPRVEVSIPAGARIRRLTVSPGSADDPSGV